MTIKGFFRVAVYTVVSLTGQEGVVFAKTQIATATKKEKIVPALIIVPAILFGVWRVTHRSGVNHKDIHRSLPGDSIVPGANWVINRSAILNAPINEVWPWIQQLGRNRAGWYAPNWLESIYGHHALKNIDTSYQHVRNGDVLDDWGPGYQRVLRIDSPNVLLVDEVKKTKSPTTGKDSLVSLDASILTILEKVDSIHTRIIYRLRGKVSLWYYIPARGLGGLFDFATFNMMTAGLNERLKKADK